MSLKPMYKWVGGKAKLVPTLRQHIYRWLYGYEGPFDYVEPFLGGGAFALLLMSETHLNKMLERSPRFYLSDVNADLINVWRQFECDPYVLCDALHGWANNYNAANAVEREQMYYEMRTRYTLANRRAELDIDQAFRFMFINKTCFNGLYRTNAKGEFNVTWNKAESIRFDYANLRAVGERLRQADVSIKTQSWEQAVEPYFQMKRPTFIYFDPPYDVPEDKPGFTAYDKSGFGVDDQARLADRAFKLARAGCGVMVSNADTPLVRRLYSPSCGWRIHEVSRAGTVSSKGTGRERVGELLITMF